MVRFVYPDFFVSTAFHLSSCQLKTVLTSLVHSAATAFFVALLSKVCLLNIRAIASQYHRHNRRNRNKHPVLALYFSISKIFLIFITGDI